MTFVKVFSDPVERKVIRNDDKSSKCAAGNQVSTTQLLPLCVGGPGVGIQ